MQAVRTWEEHWPEGEGEVSIPVSARSWRRSSACGWRTSGDSLDKQGQLSRSGKLNSCFDSIPIASFLHTFIGDQLVEIPSDATLVEVVDILSRNLIKLGSYQILE
jgi:hypothetical protein